MCKSTGVKSSRIYTILSELEQVGLVIVLNTSPKRYIATPLVEGLPNLQEHIEREYTRKKEVIKEKGINEFVKNERSRWKCSNCGGVINVHRYRCSVCGEGTQ